MIPSPEKLGKVIPALYATEKIPLAEKEIKVHLFIGSADWYLVEYNKEDDLGFGYANLGNDAMSEWGYVSIEELRSVKVHGIFTVDFDKHWTVKKAKDIKNIIYK
jgi:hypothetical protein